MLEVNLSRLAVKKRIILGVCVVLELFYNIADSLTAHKTYSSHSRLYILLPLMWHLVKVWVGSLWPFTTLCPSPFSPISSLNTIADWQFRKGTRNGGSLYWIKIVFTTVLNSNRHKLDSIKTHKALRVLDLISHNFPVDNVGYNGRVPGSASRVSSLSQIAWPAMLSAEISVQTKMPRTRRINHQVWKIGSFEQFMCVSVCRFETLNAPQLEKKRRNCIEISQTHKSVC